MTAYLLQSCHRISPDGEAMRNRVAGLLLLLLVTSSHLNAQTKADEALRK
jgi:hypothetical protein